MKNTTMLGLGLASTCLALTLANATPAAPAAAGGPPMFEVTVTNLTRNQILSPMLVISHEDGVHIFSGGQPASSGLTALAEEGNNMPLAMMMGGNPKVHDVQPGAGGILPGASDTVMVSATSHARYISLATMLVNTNDAFAGLDSFEIAANTDTTTHAVAYDAGTEFNSESCSFIPGPACGAGGMHDPMPAEGFVYVSNGVQGIGGLDKAVYDWRNPVAKVTIRRVVGMR